MSEINTTITFPNSGLQSDLGPQFMQLGDSNYRINVVSSVKDNTGNLANILGNALLPLINLPTGNNKVIGFCDNGSNKGYYFVYNDANNHSIIEFDRQSNSCVPVLYSEDVLGFKTTNLINNPHTVGEELLYFTDGINSPRKLNIKKSIGYTRVKTGSGIGSWYVESPNPPFIVS